MHGTGDGVNVLAMVKDGHRYVFLYDDSSGPRLLETFGRYAADPELDFSWYDAAVMSQRVRAIERDRAAQAMPQTYRRAA